MAIPQDNPGAHPTSHSCRLQTGFCLLKSWAPGIFCSLQSPGDRQFHVCLGTGSCLDKIRGSLSGLCSAKKGSAVSFWDLHGPMVPR